MSLAEASKSRTGVIIILSSPSGAGKSTIARQILADLQNIYLSVSVTTRAMRQGERDGVDYHFISPKEYQHLVKTGGLLEYAQVFDHGYGTPKAQVSDNLASGNDVLFDIDWQGAQQIRAAMPEKVISLFILPPTRALLESRLRTRSTDSEAVIKRRMDKADQEISHYKEYDWVLVNDDLKKTCADVALIIASERLRLTRQPVLHHIAQGLLSENFQK